MGWSSILLEQVGEHDLLFGNHHAMQTGFGRMALDLWAGQNGSALLDNPTTSRDTGTVAQFVAGNVDGELPAVLMADCTGFGDSRAEK